MDIFSRTKRSQIMSKISAKGTKPEVLVRSFLFRHGFRFRKNVKSLPGSPDIVLPKYKTAIFINGCFWHGHLCKKGDMPKSNTEFWSLKIRRNVERDIKVRTDLENLGWTIFTIWTCELNNISKFNNTMTNLLNNLV